MMKVRVHGKAANASPECRLPFPGAHALNTERGAAAPPTSSRPDAKLRQATTGTNAKHETLSATPTMLTVRIPFAIRKRSGRKRVLSPDGSTPILSRTEPNSVIVKAIARAYRWRDLLESGDYATIDELAKAEGINPSYLSRTLRLTMLAPNVVEAALDQTYVVDDLSELTRSISTLWNS